MAGDSRQQPYLTRPPQAASALLGHMVQMAEQPAQQPGLVDNLALLKASSFLSHLVNVLEKHAHVRNFLLSNLNRPTKLSFLVGGEGPVAYPPH